MALTSKQILDSDYKMSRWAKIEAAQAEGCEVIMGDNYHLLLDFDDCEWCPDLTERLAVLKAASRVGKIESWRSYSGEGWHVVVELKKPLPLSMRFTLQAALGSDWKREMLGTIENQYLLTPLEPFLIKPGIKRAIEIYTRKGQ